MAPLKFVPCRFASALAHREIRFFKRRFVSLIITTHAEMIGPRGLLLCIAAERQQPSRSIIFVNPAIYIPQNRDLSEATNRVGKQIVVYGRFDQNENKYMGDSWLKTIVSIVLK